MKLNKVITEKEMRDLQSLLPHIDLNKDFTDDEWFDLVDIVQDKAIELLQANDARASYLDEIAVKISAYEN